MTGIHLYIERNGTVVIALVCDRYSLCIGIACEFAAVPLINNTAVTAAKRDGCTVVAENGIGVFCVTAWRIDFFNLIAVSKRQTEDGIAAAVG